MLTLPLSHGLHIGLTKWTERPSTWIEGPTCSTHPKLLARNRLSGLHAPVHREVSETEG